MSQKSLRQSGQLREKLHLRPKEAISYGIPTLKLKGNLVHFAGYRSHIGFYPGSKAMVAFKKELSHYKT